MSVNLTKDERSELEIRCLDLSVAVGEVLRTFTHGGDHARWGTEQQQTARVELREALFQHDLTMLKILTRKIEG